MVAWDPSKGEDSQALPDETCWRGSSSPDDGRFFFCPLLCRGPLEVKESNVLHLHQHWALYMLGSPNKPHSYFCH